jgi:hypothetical protein
MAYVVAWVLVLNFGWHSVWADEPNMDHPFLVQAINAQNERDYVLAQDLFEQYIETLPDREQGLFLDFTYVGSGKDLKTYARVSESEKEAVKRRFWTRTDPSPLTKVNERLIEHYRHGSILDKAVFLGMIVARFMCGLARLIISAVLVIYR